MTIKTEGVKLSIDRGDGEFVPVDGVKDVGEVFGIVSVLIAYSLARGGWFVIVEGPQVGRHSMTTKEAEDFAVMYRSARERVGLKPFDEELLKELGSAIGRAKEGNDAEGHTIQ